MKKYLLAFSLLLGAHSWAIQPINAIVGDASYLQKFGNLPDNQTDDVLRIQTHLEYVEKALRATDVSHLSTAAQENRLGLLGDLHNYWMAGKFPQLPVPFESRQPCFIDDAGTLCAVGYLVGQSEGLKVAEEINRKHRFEYVMEMNDPMLDLWAEQNGFTLKELAMIQPTYSWEPRPEPIEPIMPPPIEIPIEQVLRNQLAALQVKYDSTVVRLQREEKLAEQRSVQLAAAEQKNQELQRQMVLEREQANKTITRKKRFNYVLAGVAASLGTLATVQWIKIRNSQ